MNKWGILCRSRRAWNWTWMVLICGVWLWSSTPPLHAADPVDAGFRDFSYGAPNVSCTSTPTGEKPESKLWFHDGFWWGSLCNDAAKQYRIYRFDPATQTWVDTQTVLDDRPATKADVLWDASSQKLYVASHVFTTSGASSSSASNWGRLYRYSYNAGSKTYARDPGFPVNITRGKSETLTLNKDSNGQLWVTYVEGSQVMINHSRNGSDSDWGTPYVLPVSGATGLTSDDISALISYQGKIGVMWSNQNTQTMYFARHLDTDANDQSWESASAYRPGGSGADDHINLKSLQSDDAGRIFAVTKTSFSSSSQPLILLLVCKAEPCTTATNWRAHTIYTVQNKDTRPILLIDTDRRELHVFTANTGSSSEISHKMTAIDNIQFPAGEGDVFIKNTGDDKINDPTSTKQNVNATTGILVLASSQLSRYYYHNSINLGSANPGGGSPPTISSFTPTSGPVGTQVTVAGNYFSGATAVTFNGVSAPFTLDSATQLRATVPTGASSGPIRVVTGAGTGVSAASFSVTAPPANQAPSVNAGPDQTITLPASAPLHGVVSDDGLPNPPGALTTNWSKVSGPGTVSFANANAVDTTATFATAGTYVLRLTATDSALSTSDELTILVTAAASANTLDVRVNTSTDDAEERVDGAMSRASTDLEMTFEKGAPQTVGIRFAGITIPRGATITQAYIQFKADEKSSGATSLQIQAENVGNATTFRSSAGNISTRTRTAAAVTWTPEPWTQVGEAGPPQRTPDLAPVIREIVTRSDWSSGNALVFIITGSGDRVAKSYDGEPGGAPLLHVEHTGGSQAQANSAPIQESSMPDNSTENDDDLGSGAADDPEEDDIVHETGAGVNPAQFIFLPLINR